jgi:hypothetical protein
MPDSPELARKGNGDIRVDYSVNGAGRIRVWEPRPTFTLETTFRHDGAILLQISIAPDKTDERIRETLAECGAAAPVEAPYKEVNFDRACPWCSKHELVRVAHAYRSSGEVPVMPLYHCKGCRGRSYYITDEYLTHLIASNPGMFEGSDMQRFLDDRDAFVAEIKAYIISSFASKRVKRID